MKAALKIVLHRAGLFRPVARIAHELLNTAQGQYRRRLLSLYRPLIRPGQLVFDIGAHDGTYAEAFAALGARVIAAEPNPATWRSITMRCPSRVTLIRQAIGANAGTAILHRPSHPGYSQLASISTQWVAIARTAHRFQGHDWNDEITVPVTTLDALRAEYGEPDYIKIDVEGLEEAVLSGLSRQPRLLSFEYIAENTDALWRCLDRPLFRSRSRFNYLVGSADTLASPEWLERDAFLRIAEHLPPETSGDVFVLH